MTKQTLNLDQLAAERAQEMVRQAQQGIKGVKKPVETLERLTTKTLGVLQAQGVYAMMLFLFSRSGDEKSVAPLIQKQLHKALKMLPTFQSDDEIPTVDANREKMLEFYASDKLLGDLDTLLLVRDLYEQTLIYARYGAKATKGE